MLGPLEKGSCQFAGLSRHAADPLHRFLHQNGGLLLLIRDRRLGVGGHPDGNLCEASAGFDALLQVVEDQATLYREKLGRRLAPGESVQAIQISQQPPLALTQPLAGDILKSPGQGCVGWATARRFRDASSINP